MDITVLGSGAAYPRPGGACSGFLLAAGTTKIWLDAGNGAFANLQKHVDFHDLDALILTHGHADHIADVLPFMYALGFDPVRPATTALPVYAPQDVGATIAWPLGGTSKDIFERVFEIRSIIRPFEVGDLRFEPFRTFHPAETYGLRIRDGEKLVVYTSDTALFGDLEGACRGADLLITEATYIDGVDASPGIHMWAREAGKVASMAGVKRLVLTHIWSTFDPQQAVAEAAEEFDGPVQAATEGDRYTV